MVFNKLPPHETFWIEMTPEVELMEVTHNSLVQFEVWDFPGSKKLSGACLTTGNTIIIFFLRASPSLFLRPLLSRADPLPPGYAVTVGADESKEYSGIDLLRRAGAVVFVMDAQRGFDEETAESLRRLLLAIANHAPYLSVDLFLHKMDGDALQSGDHRMEMEAMVQSRVLSVMREIGISGVGRRAAGPTKGIAYYMTNIYDHTIYQSLSKVVQRLVKPLVALETLLDRFIQVRLRLLRLLLVVFPNRNVQPRIILDFHLCLFLGSSTAGSAKPFSTMSSPRCTWRRTRVPRLEWRRTFVRI